MCLLPLTRLQVLELLKKRGECSGENFDSLGLLQTLCLVKMDSVDGRKSAGKPDQVQMNVAESAGSPSARARSPSDSKTGTEMRGGYRDGGHRGAPRGYTLLLLFMFGCLNNPCYEYLFSELAPLLPGNSDMTASATVHQRAF